jgi:Ala-tRNA(Pro) deacylase
MKMTTLQTCLSYLDQNAIRYTHTTHPAAYTARQVAVAEFMPAKRVAKTVVFRGDRGYVLVLVPADSYVDAEQVRTAIDSRKIRKAGEAELRELFPDAELGAITPLSCIAQMPIYLDRALADREFITFTAGTHRDVIHMRTADFRLLTIPVVGDFSKEYDSEEEVFPMEF